MPFISGKHIPRRTMLRGLGATVALPFLDAMVPARALWSRTAGAASLDRTRLVCIEMGHGSAAGRGRAALRPPRALRPRAPSREAVPIVSDTGVRPAEAVTQPEIGGDHFR